MNKDIRNSFFKFFYGTLGVFSALIISACLILSFLWIIKIIQPNFYNMFSSSYFRIPESANIVNSRTTYCLKYLVAQGKIVSVQDAFGYMISFYDSLITFLIGILGVFGIVSWISLTGKVKHDAERSVDEKIKNEDFRCRLNLAINDSVKNVFEEHQYEIVDQIQNELIAIIEAEDSPTNKLIQNLLNKKIENRQQILGDQDGNKV